MVGGGERKNLNFLKIASLRSRRFLSILQAEDRASKRKGLAKMRRSGEGGGGAKTGGKGEGVGRRGIHFLPHPHPLSNQ